MPNSSSRGNAGIVIIIIVVALLALWFFTHKSSSTSQTENATGQTAQQNTANATGIEQIKNSGSSDTALNQDSAKIDAEMNGLGADASAALQ
jgi:cell shape-determining protein MreC